MLLIPLALLGCDALELTFDPLDMEDPPPLTALHVDALGRQPTCWVSVDHELTAVGLRSEEQVVLGALPAGTLTWTTDGEQILAFGRGLSVATVDALEFTEVEDAPDLSSAVWTGARWLTFGNDGVQEALTTDDLLASVLAPLDEVEFSGWRVMAGRDDRVFEVDDSDQLVSYTLPDGTLAEIVDLRRSQWGPMALALTDRHAITLSSLGDGTLRGSGVYLRRYDRTTGRRLETIQVAGTFGGAEPGLACVD